MLTKTTPSDLSKTIRPPENLHSAQESSASFQPPFSVPTFNTSDGDNHSDKEDDLPKGENESQSLSGRANPEIFGLIFRRDFHEMLRLFLIPHHEEILRIRSILRDQRDTDVTPVLSPRSHSQSIEFLRKHLYQVQMQLFHSPKGRHCHLSI